MGWIKGILLHVLFWLWERGIKRVFKRRKLEGTMSPFANRRLYGTFNKDGTFVWRHDLEAKWHYSDPWEVDRQCKKHGGDNWGEALGVLKSAAEASQIAPELANQSRGLQQRAFSDLALLARQVWGLKSVEEAGEHGWSDSMCFMLLMDYLHGAAAIGEEFLPLPKQLA